MRKLVGKQRASATPTKVKKSPDAEPPHTHRKGHCLDILRQLSAFIDDELSADICRDIRRHLGACPHCEEFVASLRQTVSLCRHHPTPGLSAAERARIRSVILQRAAGR